MKHVCIIIYTESRFQGTGGAMAVQIPSWYQEKGEGTGSRIEERQLAKEFQTPGTGTKIEESRLGICCH